ncbi:chemotaxis protein CheD [Pseudomonas gingeri]|uniref:chemotaxis protein CheD n=1 Tax=Pseudomonas gingeri TaxID=117681 RepID=UPI0015A3DED1|nr:chemotaxis protein CheD [Pseudomonas gingeri]NWA27486.1 chemotaxis protein CheD [Pseudomonas gingeri]
MDVEEIYLAPGSLCFRSHPTRIHTLLGSCVSMVLWHPVRKLGGISHCLLPGRRQRGEALDGSYIDEAFEWLMQHIQGYRSEAREYQLKLFGGGEMFPEQSREGAVGDIAGLNCAAVRRIAEGLQLSPSAMDLGGTGHRSLIFDTWSGAVWVRHLSLPTVESRHEKNKCLTGR